MDSEYVLCNPSSRCRVGPREAVQLAQWTRPGRARPTESENESGQEESAGHLLEATSALEIERLSETDLERQHRWAELLDELIDDLICGS